MPHPKTEPPDAARDSFELELVRLALEGNVPILGVCRGLQVMNVAAGGTLIQDIASEVNHPLGHHIDSPLYAIAHEVWVARDSATITRMPGKTMYCQLRPVNGPRATKMAAMTTTAPM